VAALREKEEEMEMELELAFYAMSLFEDGAAPAG